MRLLIRSRIIISCRAVLNQRHGTRFFATETSSSSESFFKLFPRTFPNGGPPRDPFKINDKSLRREYRALQSSHHPDISQDTLKSSNINKAFTTLKNPYLRLAHLIQNLHGKDITNDSVSKEMIRKYQTERTENSAQYKEMLMQVMEAHEQLELAELENELEGLEAENSERIEQAEEKIDKELSKKNVDDINWDELIMDAIKLKYWVNIQNGIKDWEPGKPVHLTH
ncbi:hypothetical protein KGF56_004780 [Candida oxycetoniae]|uniref:Co-chaperone HscB C-terminal oligomerisation domain-containing protein n=1 Tax=Candida oxycetoniae TaxID=497107 RepID=A0AAI9STG0_9ASCO|nr:uncharacterized protein KGF56_004780 [Candida oxycetoniae]KAI3402372.2 hypothetical protein KGF56_004780 [Candida oxycetoniae]